MKPVRWAYLLLSVLALALIGVIPARAHAALVGSEPAAGSVLAEAPAFVVLDFTEELDAGAATVELRDGQGDVIVEGPGVIDASLPTRLRLELPPLPDGIYTAVWQARSAVDGHITKGTVAFAVGADATAPSLLPPPGTAEPATAVPETADALLRWLNYLAAAVAVGSLLFGWLVWRPAAGGFPAAAASDAEATALLRRLALVGSMVWAVATLLFVAVQAVQLGADSLWEGLLVIMGGRGGLLIGLRLGLLLLLALIAQRLPSAGYGRLAPWLIASAAGAAALLTVSLQSHSAALPGGQSIVATVADWLHLLAMAAWLGGLLSLALLLWLGGAGPEGAGPGRARPGLASALVPRFSRVALASVAILTLTGLYSSLVHVRTIEALTATTHGRALVLKLGLFVVLLALGAINLLLISPLLRKNEPTAARRLRRTVRVELALGAAVLLAVGVMTAVSPAFEAVETQNRLGFRGSARIDDVEMVLRVAPFHLGDNEFAVDIIDNRQGAAQAEPLVLLRFENEDQDMGISQVETRPEAGGRFLARGAFLSVAGNWQVEVILRRDGFNDARRTFELLIEPDDHHGDEPAH